MKKQPRMTKNRIEITVTRSYVTDESAEQGDFDRHEEINRWIYLTLEEAADQLAYVMHADGFCADYSSYEDITGIYGDDFIIDYSTGESATDYLCTRFGANFDTAAAREKLTELVFHRLQSDYGYTYTDARAKVGRKPHPSPLAVNDNFSYPDQKPKLYLVK